MESVFLTQPVITIGFALALALLVTCFAKRMHGILVACAMLIFMPSSISAGGAANEL